MKLLVIMVFCLKVGIVTALGNSGPSGEGDVGPRYSEEVQIAGNCVRMPLGGILLVRKGFQSCAVRLAEMWTGETEEDRFTKYESYYQGDGSGDFSNKNVLFTREQLAERRGIWFFRIMLYRTGRENKEIKCGPIKLFCFRGAVYFYREGRQKPGDYGIEFAPTKWTDISQVNAFDPRLKWYRYDEKRKDMFIPIDQLWEDGEEKK